MTPSEAARQPPTCTRCGVAVEGCAFCERAACPDSICSRCLRTELRESLPQPHAHGG